MEEITNQENHKMEENKETKESFCQKMHRKIVKDFDLNYFVIILVAFSQGIMSLSDLAMSYLYKDDLHLEPYQVTRVVSLSVIPWIIKPVYGFISDSFPIFGYRRKPYLMIFGFIGVCCWITMSFWVNTVTFAVIVMIIFQTSTAFCNVIGEALVVETSQKQRSDDPESGAKNVSLYFMVRAIGHLIAAFFSGYLLEIMDKRKVFLITAIFPLLIIISAIMIKEESRSISTEEDRNDTLERSDQAPRQSKWQEIKSQLGLFCSFLQMGSIYKPVIFIFLYTIAPSYGDPMFYFYTNVLKFTPIVMGRLRLIYGIASVLGIFIFNKFLHDVSFKKIIWGTTILSIFFNLLSIILVTRVNLKMGIPDFFFCMTADALTTALGEINSMPLLVIACNICPKNIEGTLYAFLMSVLNCGGLIANQFGALLTSWMGISSTNFVNLPWLILAANIIILLPMPSLYLVDDNVYSKKKDTKREEEEEEEKEEQTDLLQSESSKPEDLYESSTNKSGITNAYSSNEAEPHSRAKSKTL